VSPVAIRLMRILWPAFLAACAMQVLVFAFVDPQDIRWAGRALALSRQGVYTTAFFAFWTVIALACAMTVLLERPVDEPAESQSEGTS